MAYPVSCCEVWICVENGDAKFWPQLKRSSIRKFNKVGVVESSPGLNRTRSAGIDVSDSYSNVPKWATDNIPHLVSGLLCRFIMAPEIQTSV